VRAIYQISMNTHDARPSERVEQLGDALKSLSLDEETLALLKFVVRLTAWPSSMTKREVERLEGVGFDTRSIHDIVQVVACFSFMNRLADGTGVTLRADRKALGIEMFGEDAWQLHQAWSAGGAS